MVIDGNGWTIASFMIAMFEFISNTVDPGAKHDQLIYVRILVVQ